MIKKYDLIKKRDFFIVFALLIIAAALYIASPKGKGSVVQIDYNGTRYAEVEFELLGEGEVRSFIVNQTEILVDNSGALFTSSACKSQICVNAGRINKVGQIVVCLPQRVSIRITGTTEGFDAITT